MGPPTSISRHLTPPASRAARAALGLAALLVTTFVQGCASRTEPPLEPPAPISSSGSDLVIQLHFGAEADLDLFVTDPDHEEIYFGNPTSRLGGSLEADRLCSDPAPRTEIVRFTTPPAGVYRVSVDFPQRCTPSTDEALYTISVHHPTTQQQTSGRLKFGHTEIIALEFTIPPTNTRPPESYTPPR